MGDMAPGDWPLPGLERRPNGDGSEAEAEDSDEDAPEAYERALWRWTALRGVGETREPRRWWLLFPWCCCCW